MASIASSTGLGSGIDIKSLVTQLVSAEKAPVTSRLDKQEASLTAKLSSFGTFKSALSSFKATFSALQSASAFHKTNVTSSNETILSGTAESNADLGSYRIEVKQLAQSHALATAQVYDNASATVGTGLLTIKFGTNPTGADFVQNSDKGTLSLVIDNTNNTLTGIRDAINKANAGVSAAVVYNGTGYQLVLNSTDGGEENAMQISGLSDLAYNSDTANNKMAQTQIAKDAIAGINGLEVRSSSNTISDALKGLTLDLKKAELGTVVDLEVAQSSTDVTKAMEAFVKGYNDLVKAVKDVASYDAANKKGGILQGDAAVLGTMSMIRSELSRFVQGLTGSYKGLAEIGVRVQSDGSLKLDGSVLNKALANDRDAVAAVFSVLGRPSDSAVQYVEASSGTAAGSYSVNVTRVATQGTMVGTQALNFPFVVDSSNKTLKLSVDGVISGEVNLTEGNYTSQSLVAELQSRINGDNALKSAGVSVSVSLDLSNHLVMTAKSFGSSSRVGVVQDNVSLGFAVGVGSTNGLDIAGSIDGTDAEGNGQELTAISGSATGLKLLIEGDATGDRGSVDFSRGMMERLEKALTSMLESKGTVNAKSEGLQKSLDKIQDERDKLDERMSKFETQLLKRFTAMDSLVGRLQSTSSYLTQALANLPYNSSTK